MNESPTPTKAGTTPTQPTLRSDGLTAPDPQSHDCWPSTPTCDECGAEIGIVMDVKETR